ncbi:Uncharacterised protein [Mycobacteroides abscessus]|nr:Uncharacterised protein [Mycobacteroides abscessus]
MTSMMTPNSSHASADAYPIWSSWNPSWKR